MCVCVCVDGVWVCMSAMNALLKSHLLEGVCPMAQNSGSHQKHKMLRPFQTIEIRKWEGRFHNEYGNFPQNWNFSWKYLIVVIHLLNFK